MLFSVFTLDKPGTEETRKKVHGDHVAHLKKAKDFGVAITVGGPLVSDDGASSVGSLMVIEGQDRATVEKFNRNDPFYTNGIWGTVEIRRFDRKQ